MASQDSVQRGFIPIVGEHLDDVADVDHKGVGNWLDVEPLGVAEDLEALNLGLGKDRERAGIGVW